MKKRSLVKALTFRVLATLVTCLLVYFVTGRISFAVEIGILDFVVKVLVYYLHERAWTGVRWGNK